MERMLKRKRLSLSPETEAENESDLSHVGLQEARAQNDLRLKSIFEGIFEKYGRDFTDVGDEIDLQTGDILVNNGHLNTLNEEDNTGAIEDWLLDSEPSAPSNERAGSPGETNVTTGHHTEENNDGEANEQHSRREVMSSLSQMLLEPKESRGAKDEAAGTTSEAEDDRSSVDSLLDTALCVQDMHAREVGTSETVTEKAISRIELSDQSQSKHNGRLDETVDPTWPVPEISTKLTTPTVLNRSIRRPISSTVRSQSPPGSASLWALPLQSRRSTDVVKRRKQKDSPKKPKNQPPKPVSCDWSFADTPDGSESDDPLQDYEPSPTPKGAVYIREKRKDRSVATCRKNTCNYCKSSFSERDYVSHLRTVLSGPADSEHDLIDLKKELQKLTGQSSGTSTCHESSPAKNKWARTTLGEAKLIIRMKVAQGMNWEAILNHFPQKNLNQLKQWYRIHWTERQADHQLSKPWSKAELKIIARLKDQTNLSWPEIRAELPERSQSEVEFELLQLWASGDNNST
ncbi:centromere protein Scm3-domain-containing protein [Aspergillus heterothallicus]